MHTMQLIHNKSAFFHYEILETLTAGMVLQGWQVKSLRAKNAHLKSAWIKIINEEVFLVQMHISPWKFETQTPQTSNSDIKLLLKKKEIRRLKRQIDEKKLTLVPLKIGSHKKHIKCDIGLAKGRKRYEKKQVLKERSQKREAQQVLKNFNN